MLGYDATARHFVPRQHGYEGDTPVDLSSIDADHPQIQFRKDHLNRYFMQLIGRSYDAKMVQYLDMVGKIHTSQAGNSEIDVPLVQMNALMGVIADQLLLAVLGVATEPRRPHGDSAGVQPAVVDSERLHQPALLRLMHSKC